MRQILSILMENEAGALSNMIGLFSQRSLNIESLTVVPTIDRTLSQVTLNTVADTRTMDRIAKQINKLIDVLSVTVMTDSGYHHAADPEVAAPDATAPMVKMMGMPKTNGARATLL